MRPAECTPFKDTVELREQVIATCRSLAGLGYCIGTWGNVSVRVDDGLVITPSRLDYSAMTPDDLVVVSWTGSRLRGHRLPSSETELHRQLLLHRKDLGAFVHSHAPYCSALAAARRDLPVCLEDMAQIIGGTVRCTTYVPGGRHAELAEAACQAIGTTAAAALMANHGVVVGGRSLNEALTASQVLEKAACVFIMAQSIGGAQPIPPEMVEEERYRFFFKYGKEDPTAGK